MADNHAGASGMTRLRNYFFTGLIVSAPLALTIYFTWSLVGWIDSWVKPYIPARYSPDTYLPFPVPGFGLLVALFLITIIGFSPPTSSAGRSSPSANNLLDRMPWCAASTRR